MLLFFGVVPTAISEETAPPAPGNILTASGTCDANTTKASTYKIPMGYFVEVEVADGRSFFGHDTETEALFFIQEKNSTFKKEVPEQIWRMELAKAAPNFYTSFTPPDRGDCAITRY